LKISRYVFSLLALAACFFVTSRAFGQIQPTNSCAAGNGYWDILSIMMMDPGLAANYHMEGITEGLPSSYIYTHWDANESKVYYTKNPQGNPWDINLYDSKFIYQWVTELGTWNGKNHWNDPTSCRKFNNGAQKETSDLSMRWAPRCAVPGGKNSSFWNSPPVAQPINTNYYTYVGKEIQSSPQNLEYSWLELRATGTTTIEDHRANPPERFSVTTVPLHYTYSCSVSGNANSCKFLEIFQYAVDTTVNPVDKIKHSYGWIGWHYYINATGGDAKKNPVWTLSGKSISDHLMAGQVSPNFQCF